MTVNDAYLSRLYGLNIASNAPLLDFASGAALEGEIDVQIDFVGESAIDPSRIAHDLLRDGSGDSSFVISRLVDGGLVLRLQQNRHYGEFSISPNGLMLRVAWEDSTPLSEIMPFLMNIGLGLLLRARGLLCLHGAALAKDDRAIILIGAKGAGKSTTTAALIARGWQLLADDISVVTRRGEIHVVESGYPRLRLLPETSAYFGSWVKDLPRLWQHLDVDKRYLPAEALTGHFCDHALPLSAIYYLAPRQPTLEAPLIEPVEGINRLLLLANNLYAAYALDSAARAREINVLEAILQSIPLQRIVRPDAIDVLPATLDLIERDLTRIVSPASII